MDWIDALPDFSNLLFLLVPGLLVILFVTPNVLRTAVAGSRSVKFLSSVLLVCLAVAFVFDPKLGMPRDWDLFAFAGVPLAILSYLLLFMSSERIPATGRAAVLVISLGFLSLIPRAIAQVVPEISIQHVEAYFELDVPHVFHVAGYCDNLHETFHLIFDVFCNLGIASSLNFFNSS